MQVTPDHPPRALVEGGAQPGEVAEREQGVRFEDAQRDPLVRDTRPGAPLERLRGGRHLGENAPAVAEQVVADDAVESEDGRRVRPVVGVGDPGGDPPALLADPLEPPGGLAADQRGNDRLATQSECDPVRIAGAD